MIQSIQKEVHMSYVILGNVCYVLSYFAACPLTGGTNISDICSMVENLR